MALRSPGQSRTTYIEQGAMRKLAMWKWLERILTISAPKNSHLLASIYYGGQIFGFVINFVLVVVSAIVVTVTYFNRADRTGNSDLVEPFGSWVPNGIYIFIIQNRWSIFFSIIAISFVIVASKILKLKKSAHGSIVLARIFTACSDFIENIEESRQIIESDPENRTAALLQGKLPPQLDIYLSHYCTEAARMFRCIHGTHCHVSVKMYNPGTMKVLTVARDSMSSEERDAVDKDLGWYPYNSNTAYVDIFDPDKPAYFICNNLPRAYRNGTYKNGNPIWSKFYSSTLVVPITALHKNSHHTPEVVWGFLTVDSLTASFSSKVDLPILRAVASAHANVMAKLIPILDAADRESLRSSLSSIPNSFNGQLPNPPSPM